jgi:hypothetical protein
MKKKGMKYVLYDPESVFVQSIDNLHDYFKEYMLQNRVKCVYACKEIRSGKHLEVEIFPEFTKSADLPPEARERHREAQRNLNSKNAVKECQRLINENFHTGDIWLTLTYREGQEPVDMDEATGNMQKFIKRINYRRKKMGLPNAKYLYITEHDPEASIRWHHHILMDGMLDRDTVEKTWKKGERPQSRFLEEDRDGLAGMAHYITKDKHREKYEKRWNCSKGLRQPKVRKVYSKKKGGIGRYIPISKYIDKFVRDKSELEAEVSAWYKDYNFIGSEIYYNDVNKMFYIRATLRDYRKENRNERC